MILKDKVALITGGASGMGKAEALAFAAKGAKVVVADINYDGAKKVVNEIVENGGSALALQVNMTNSDEINGMVQDILNEFSQIDILVNNAGIFDKYKTSLETSEEDWDFFFNINLKSAFLLTNLVLPGMISRGNGTIINISSVAGLVAGKGGAAYTASKHGLIGYTKHLASVYASKGIKVNAICPGTIITPLTKDILENIPVDQIPAGRFGQQEEVAELAVFLASDQAQFMNGTAIPIDGGFTIQ
ncbi:SDR family oxidoreductase [Bacillus sp. V3B]|uniref:SDR family NAD(P)-dependent oxidoreductase n=1 Tax=Bacillus sp. V3B TaxID=2804915 RepID=UPI00210D3828|nr:SDR family NAD(P)-dependent oxidoreductase [Bacillus sp. V3B]MCQ6276041.1 SDR family oxidoreductase [Bacillus sp. V3B]